MPPAEPAPPPPDAACLPSIDERKLPMFIRILTCALGIFVLAGCAGPGANRPVKVPTEDEASITVYRPNGFVNGGGYPYVYVDDEKVGSVMNAGHIVFGVSPGSHKLTLQNIWLWDGKQGLTFDAQRGERRYYRVISKFNSAMVIRPMLMISKTVLIEEVPEAEALEEVAKTTRSD